MQNRRIVFMAFAVLLLIGAGGFGGWFWSLGSAQAGELLAVSIEVVRPPVDILRTGEETWFDATGATPLLPGDRIRTGEDGEARIIWGDRGYTRIDPSSELVVERAPLDGSLAPGAEIRLRVERGRVWSRLLKLLDLDASMQVRTSDVVATVRGTTFGVIRDADGTQAAVSESVIEVAGDVSSTLLRDNQWGLFLTGGVPVEIRDLRPDDAWAQRHIGLDRIDDERFSEYLRQASERSASRMPRAGAFWIDAAEGFRLRVASRVTAPRLAEAYAERRLARAWTFGDARDWNAFVRYADMAGEGKGRLLGALHARVASRARETGIDALAFERDVRRALAHPSDAARAYLDAVVLDEQIDDAMLRTGSRAPASLARIGATIDLFEARIDVLRADESEKDGLRKKTEALRKRLAHAMSLPAPSPEESPSAEPMPELLQGGQIPDPAKPPAQVLKPAEDASAPSPTPESVVYARFTLLASPSIADVGVPVRLSLYGITSEGRADDLTPSATFFSSRSGDGSVSGNLFTPAFAGTITLTGTYADRDGLKSASAVITVRTSTPQDAGLQSVRLSFTGPTTLPCSGRSSFKVFATYGDGKTQDVTMLARLTISDSKLIYANNDGTLMTFCAAETSTATLTADYTEGQVTRSGSAQVTVEPEPPPTTGGQDGGRYPYIY